MEGHLPLASNEGLAYATWLWIEDIVSIRVREDAVREKLNGPCDQGYRDSSHPSICRKREVQEESKRKEEMNERREEDISADTSRACLSGEGMRVRTGTGSTVLATVVLVEATETESIRFLSVGVGTSHRVSNNHSEALLFIQALSEIEIYENVGRETYLLECCDAL